MSGASFSKQKRLLTAVDYRLVFEESSYKISRRYFLLLARKNTFGRARLGLVTAKKHVRLSTARNRIKRVVRDTFRIACGHLDSLDVVFLARRGFDTLQPTQQTRELQLAWENLAAKVLRGGE